MSTSTSSRGLMPALILVSLAALSLTGCAAGAAGGDLSVRPDAKPLSKHMGKAFSLPKDEKFTITLAPASQAPGLEGKAEGKATCEAKGEGKASAKVEKGGTANGTFQLGHAVKNDSEQQIDLVVRVKFKCDYAVEAKPTLARGKTSASLRIFARDGRNRLLQSFGVVQQSSDEGKVDSNATKDVGFTITLGPGESVAIYLAGVADANLRDGETGEAKISASDVTMELEPRAAPQVKAAANP